MTNIKKWLGSLLLLALLGGVFVPLAAPVPVFAAEATTDKCNSGFLGFPAWYRGVTDDKCNIKSPTKDSEFAPFIWKIVLNVIDMGLMVAGYAAVLFILWGGFSLILHSNNSDAFAKARQTVLNAVIGLIISIAAVAIVRLIAGII